MKDGIVIESGHEFHANDRGPWRRCLLCHALIAGRPGWGYAIDNDPAGRPDGPYREIPPCAPDVTLIISPLLN